MVRACGQAGLGKCVAVQLSEAFGIGYFPIVLYLSTGVDTISCTRQNENSGGCWVLGVGCCILFCLRSGWLPLSCGISWHTRVVDAVTWKNDKRNGNSSVSFPPLMMKVSSSMHVYFQYDVPGILLS